jgi:hypothetical protein
MKAIISVQFEKFDRAMIIVEHEVSTDLSSLSHKRRRLPGVRNAAVIASHLTWVASAPDDHATTEAELTALVNERRQKL